MAAIQRHLFASYLVWQHVLNLAESANRSEVNRLSECVRGKRHHFYHGRWLSASTNQSNGRGRCSWSSCAQRWITFNGNQLHLVTLVPTSSCRCNFISFLCSIFSFIYVGPALFRMCCDTRTPYNKFSGNSDGSHFFASNNFFCLHHTMLLLLFMFFYIDYDSVVSIDIRLTCGGRARISFFSV